MELDANLVAKYLQDYPHFFDQHAELLSSLKLASSLGGRTVSLQERQMEVVREKLKTLELQLAELVRVAQDNDAMSAKFKAWTRALLAARNDVDLPHILTNGLETIFGVPHATLRLWNVAQAYSHAWFAAAVSEDSRIFSSGLTAPFCGPNQDFEAATWLDDAPAIQSIAMLPLRSDAAHPVFGLLILGSPDPERFSADMATDFLSSIGATASAALTCLID